jgi:hypothetical protein
MVMDTDFTDLLKKRTYFMMKREMRCTPMRVDARSAPQRHSPTMAKVRDKADARIGGQPFGNGRIGPHGGVAAHLFRITKRRFAAPSTAAQLVRSHSRFIMK